MTIGDSPCKLLVDTGAALSILSSTFFDQLENKPTVLPFDYPLTAANGGDLEIVGMADLIFRLGDRIYDHRFIIAKLDEVQGILGMEFLEQYDVVIRVSRQDSSSRSVYRIRSSSFRHMCSCSFVNGNCHPTKI